MAESEGVALNQLINVALAEKLSALRTEEYFQERMRRADRAETLRILDRSGKGNPPMEHDDLPPGSAPDAERAGEKAKLWEEQSPIRKTQKVARKVRGRARRA